MFGPCRIRKCNPSILATSTNIDKLDLPHPKSSASDGKNGHFCYASFCLSIYWSLGGQTHFLRVFRFLAKYLFFFALFFVFFFSWCPSVFPQFNRKYTSKYNQFFPSNYIFLLDLQTAKKIIFLWLHLFLLEERQMNIQNMHHVAQYVLLQNVWACLCLCACIHIVSVRSQSV